LGGQLVHLRILRGELGQSLPYCRHCARSAGRVPHVAGYTKSVTATPHGVSMVLWMAVKPGAS
jgi:hypothetical protein